MNILIVEDERVIAGRLRRLLLEILGPAATSIGTAEDLGEALPILAAGNIDLLLLDLNLRGEDGFELLRQAAAGPQQTIVVSANLDRAVEAFDHGVIDFIPKPFDEARLRKALGRVEGRCPRQPGARFLAFRRGGELEVIPVEQIRAIHGAGNYAEVELINGRRLLHDKPLDQLAQCLPDRFIRIHRSHIVSLDHVRRLRSLPGSRYRVELDDGSELPVGRQRIGALRERLA